MVAHRVKIDYGYLPRRIEPCPHPGCVVDDSWFTTCGRIACVRCGIGPPVVFDSGVLQAFYCDGCGNALAP